jgi:hypothetical protein
MYCNTTGIKNTAVGGNALYKNTTGGCHTAVGFEALGCNTTGNENMAVGYHALKQNTTGQYNNAVGLFALDANTTGSCNVALGYNSGPTSAALSNTIAIGHAVSVTASNSTVIGNTNTTNTTIYGTVSAPDGVFGGVMESGLADPDIVEHEEGTVLVWENGHLIPCYEEYDHRVVGVLKENHDTAIVMGAEPVLVTGTISEGDFIVTSEKSGHGKRGVSNNLFGKVIAQALEDGTGESYSVRAMIRKL